MEFHLILCAVKIECMCARNARIILLHRKLYAQMKIMWTAIVFMLRSIASNK